MADVDIVVIGGGPAGHAAALRARQLEATVALIEEQQAGGNCVHHACIPTTILLDTLESVTRARELGIAGVLDVDDGLHWSRAVARKQQLVAAMTAGIRLQLRNRDVAFLQGRARMLDPSTVSVDLTEGGQRALTAGAGVIICTGARPRLPALPGLADGTVLWADTALRLPVPPASVALLSGGGAGATFVMEFAQLFAGAGASVTVLEPADRLLPDEEPALVEALLEMLRPQGVTILTGAHVAAGHTHDGGHTLTIRTERATSEVSAELVIAPDARVPYAEALGLETLGTAFADGALVVDERCATTTPGIYAAGDVTGGAMYSHVAARQGRVAAEAALGERTRFDPRFLPHVIATQPELASVGLTEEAAKARGYDVRTGVVDLVLNARALTMGRREGVLKLVSSAADGQILGVHALGPGAADVVTLAALAMRLEGTVDDLAALTPWHPTISESLAEAARRTAG
jgi:dihydrolipoamide dehydrogenase